MPTVPPRTLVFHKPHIRGEWPRCSGSRRRPHRAQPNGRTCCMAMDCAWKGAPPLPMGGIPSCTVAAVAASVSGWAVFAARAAAWCCRCSWGGVATSPGICGLLPRAPGGTLFILRRYSRYFCGTPGADPSLSPSPCGSVGADPHRIQSHTIAEDQTCEQSGQALRERNQAPSAERQKLRDPAAVRRLPCGACGTATLSCPDSSAALQSACRRSRRVEGHLQVAGHVLSGEARHIHDVQDPLWDRLCNQNQRTVLLHHIYTPARPNWDWRGCDC